MISAWVNSDSDIPEPEADEKATREEVEMENMHIRHRDSVYKLVGRVLDTMSVFMYQTAIFYVQMEVYNHQMACHNGVCNLEPPRSSLMAWLYIEIYCFYLYMVSAIFYIGFHQIKGIFDVREQSDMAKAITDFIIYA